MITLLTGADTFLLNHRKRALKRAFLVNNPNGQIAEFDFSLDASGVRIKAVFEMSEMNLFSQPKFLILDTPSLLSEDFRKILLEELVQKASEVEWLLIEPGNLKKTELHTKALLMLPKLQVEILDIPSDDQRKKIITEVLREEGGKITFDPGAERLFLLRVGKDTAKLYNELEKLCIYKSEGQIWVEDVELLLEAQLEDTGFQALDALARGDKEEAMLLFRNAFLWKKDALPILGLCVWQIRQLIMLREVYDTGIRQGPILAEKSGVSPYVASKLARVLEQFPLARLKQAHSLIHGFDSDIKKGLIDQGVAIDLLAWKI